MPRLKLILYFLLATIVELCAQSTADSTIITPYRKGRTMVGLAGTIRSSKIDNSNTIVSDRFINEYIFEMNLGKFIADKNLVGLVFTTSRNQITGYLDIEQELITIGPQYKLFLGKKPDMGLYFRTFFIWAYYVENSKGSQGINIVDETLNGHGLGGDIGFGYSYVISDKVSFEIGFDYMLAYFKGKFLDNHLGTEESITFSRHDYRFSFGFSILFNRMKHD